MDVDDGAKSGDGSERESDVDQATERASKRQRFNRENRRDLESASGIWHEGVVAVIAFRSLY